jgi:hypothetical protein
MIVLKVSYKSSKQNIIREHRKMVLGIQRINFRLISYYSLHPQIFVALTFLHLL